MKEPSKGGHRTTLTEERNITGVVVDVTLDERAVERDYWINVVFFDGTKATLFHDEVEIIAEK